jgi:hypothetical protein
MVMLDDLSDMLLDSVCHYFIEDFYMDIHYGNWPIVLLFGSVFVWFWDESNILYRSSIHNSQAVETTKMPHY